MEDWLMRTKLLLGEKQVENLKNKTVAIFGLGGVGSYAAEAIARSGIGSIILIDKDTIEETNINRQLIADTTTLGKQKVEVEKERLLAINPNLQVTIYAEEYNEDKKEKMILKEYSYIVDAIDDIAAKISLIEEAMKKEISIISAMGTGNKIEPTMLEVEDISKTEVCPLAKIMRKELRKRGINHLKVVYSKEIPQKKIQAEESKRVTASCSFVPSVAGLIMASEVIKDLILNKGIEK